MGYPSFLAGLQSLGVVRNSLCSNEDIVLSVFTHEGLDLPRCEECGAKAVAKIISVLKYELGCYQPISSNGLKDVQQALRREFWRQNR